MGELDDAISAHQELREYIAESVAYERRHQMDAMYALVVTKTFVFGFNTYKAIGLLLPELYYEAASSLLRILWEATLNLAWVAQDPVPRAKLFLQFTVVEKRKFYQFRVNDAAARKEIHALTEAKEELARFETTYAHVLSDYIAPDRKGRNRIRPRFTGPTIEQAARELGGFWDSEYRDLYPLLSFYTHATPGVVLFPEPPDGPLTPESFASRDTPRTTRVALWSMAVVERLYRFMWPIAGIDPSTFLAELDARTGFRSSIERTT